MRTRCPVMVEQVRSKLKVGDRYGSVARVWRRAQARGRWQPFAPESGRRGKLYPVTYRVTWDVYNLRTGCVCTVVVYGLWLVLTAVC